uniref:Uncharacterized protein n=1 Tax=viral metagenome TaxID=1070528 RepID=A0A6C0ADJ0_9ZZZZ
MFFFIWDGEVLKFILSLFFISKKNYNLFSLKK